MNKLSVELKRYFFKEERAATINLEDILSLAGERIFGFLFVILSIPSALPIPAPGYSIPFGIAMFFLAFQLVIGRKKPWLPQKMMKGSIKLETLQGVLKKASPHLERIEALARPRFAYICTSFPGRFIIGSAIALMSVSMMIPIPGTNTLPAMGIFLTGFGLLEDDGAICLGGLVLCLIGLILSSSIVIAAIWGGTSLIDVIKAWFDR